MFLEDRSCCLAKEARSTAYSTILIVAISDSHYERVAEDLEKGAIHSKVWSRICTEQESPTVTINKTLEFWSKLLANKVTSHQDFNRFYSVFRTHVVKLKREGSTTV